jgi:hypothetical protein
MRESNDLFAALSRSTFRSRFRLRGADEAYLRDKGLDLVLRHAADLIAQRLAPADPTNDGKQTPWRGHPAFVAQHATATCCRTCLAKWHQIPAGRELTTEEQAYVVGVIRQWLSRQGITPAAQTPANRLGLWDATE